MSAADRIKEDMLQDFAEAYRSFGLSKLMGRVVALLIFSPLPLSLDEIAAELEMSKGPISQITRRLSDHHLIRKIWKPGSRKDYYEIQPEIFENAFRNNFLLTQKNTRIAKKLKDDIAQANDPELSSLRQRIDEMERFYEIMEKHFQNFLDEWVVERERIYG
ncbi:MAG: MarR family transcriptional regulator [Calditrichaeota bacterium]|nr:MarR family transcriptional regulator [Calditrichota bacterium]MCB0297721.1 MarR family transcriptional regulator [Calditrichota bacterium]MCB0306088.1 MarR family transcriptional regulator [Calditrichota bacterium]MCB0315515.1 MarR family transcriptional regulator [Calditrichota bacterium]MCB9087355.1 MarR family transcriptional regulator [Calditrichia bacterium]